MLIKKHTTPQKRNSTNNSPEPALSAQHGILELATENFPRGIQSLPTESLTHVAAHLDPKSLLAVAQLNKTWNSLVNSDHTWHRAFVCQYLGVGPETDLQGAKYILLRRSTGSWRQEFILYYSYRRRWERSRNATTTHIPLHSAISGMHMMPSHGLIASSLRYGIVSRSLPFTGRVLRGFLDASGSGTGLGIGNPNTEFTPNVSACALSSDGGTAKIAWGFRNGEVAFTSANKAMDAGSRRSAAQFIRCSVQDVHEGSVSEVIWDGNWVFSAGGDGKVKLWDPKRARCIWTSGGPFVLDECVKVAAAINQGLVACAKRSGDLTLWTGVSEDMLVPPKSYSIKIPVDNPAVSHLSIDNRGALLVACEDNIFFYRVDINRTTGVAEWSKFGDAALGAVTTVAPFFTNNLGETNLVIVGTQLGCIAIYDWSDTAKTLPTRKFEAYEDGAAVTALAWNGLTLVTGSARGTTSVFDALTLEHLRSFDSPIPHRRAVPAFAGGPPVEDPAVRQILLGAERDVLFVAVGDRVMAWRAGPVPKGGYRAPRHSSGKKKEVSSKVYQQIEMRQAIAESKHVLDDQNRRVKRAYGREREQLAQLDSLGLDEVEAVEYVLMLSREEAIARQRHQPVDDGVFEGDFDLEMARSTSSASSASESSSPPTTTGANLIGRSGRSIPITPSPSGSNSKIQVSPPLRHEPQEALFSPPPSRSLPTGGVFPPVSSSVSPPRAIAGASAWSTPLKRSPASSPGTSVPQASSSSSNIKPKPKDDEMDEDLQLAIALSLSQMK
uniref:F-box domain-containing protein n=1 Tax=Mycena chlorophos TaxID=658473 RepID=A0ABQ0M5E0_MYCCL|nr:predicted protein [Mycena chlorophos]